jgi:hypothetical protein
MRIIIRTVAAATALTLGALAVPAAHAGDTWRVRIKASVTTTTAGHKIVFTGTVRPGVAAKGTKVVLQEKFKPGAKWQDQKKATVNGKGSYSVADKPTSNNVHSYRVVMPATDKHSKGVSKTVKVTVYGWQYLSDMSVANWNGFTDGTVNINGKTYDKSVFAYYATTQYVEYNLNHKCIKFRARFGISDDSTTGGQAEVDALSDGTNVYTNTFDLGQSQQKTVALAKPLKLRLEAQSTGDPGTDGYGAFASAQVLCVK